jgi:hypothetical protein
LRHVYVGGAFIGGALIGGDVVGFLSNPNQTTTNKIIKLAELSRETHL